MAVQQAYGWYGTGLGEAAKRIEQVLEGAQSDGLPAVLVLWGMGASVFINYVFALLQERADERMIGRAMSMYSLAFFLSVPAGHAQAGAVTSAFGPQACLLASSSRPGGRRAGGRR